MLVSFTDQSTNGPMTWSWDFTNDGNVNSTKQDPSYGYQEPGVYTVKQVVTNAVTLDEELKVSYICVTEGPPSEITFLHYTGLGLIRWPSQASGTTYDLVRGNLRSWLAADADFAAAGVSCLENDDTNSRASDPTVPPPGGAFFYLVKPSNCALEDGGYDTSGAGQIGSRDAGFAIGGDPCDCVDGDGDGACDPYDNCVLVTNDDQLDADFDGIGDVCDPCLGDPDNDADGDGLCAPDDNCPFDSNPEQTDADMDGWATCVTTARSCPTRVRPTPTRTGEGTPAIRAAPAKPLDPPNLEVGLAPGATFR